jgi:4-coumarate--CoA ligase
LLTDLTVIYVDISSGKEYTFRELLNTSEQIGRGLQHQWRWQKGDVMALFAPNSADIAAITFGTLWAGGVICPVNNLFTVGELASQLKLSGARGLTTNLANLEVASEAAIIAGLPLDRIILIGDSDPKGRAKHFLSMRSTTKLAEKASIIPKEDIAFLVYSSGTTGLPKGVMLSHENMVANTLQNSIPDEDMTNWKNDRSIGFLPMYHIYGN